MVRRGLLLASLVGVLGCSGGGSSTPSLPAPLQAAAPLINSLMSAVPGLSQLQAILGAGGLLGTAKAKMPADQFAQINSAVPGAEALIGEAQKAGLPGSPSALSSLNSFFSQAGISPTQVAQMVPVVGDLIRSKGGAQLADAFLAAMK
jgi:hypothetical protein